MGGGLMGCNQSSAAEFNIYADPESAKIVMDTSIEKVILPLDCTWRACITADQANQLEEIGTPASKFAADLVRLRIKGLKVNDVSTHNFEMRHKKDTVSSVLLYRYENTMAPIHDALAVAYLIDPSIVTEYVDANVDIDIAGGISDGRLVVDIHNTKKFRDPITAKVALNADSNKFAQILFENLSKTKPNK